MMNETVRAALASAISEDIDGRIMDAVPATKIVELLSVSAKTC